MHLILYHNFPIPLCRWIKACGRRGLPPRMEDVLTSVQNMLNDNPDRSTTFKDNRPGKKWIELFMNRHKGQISVRVPERVSKARAGVTEAEIRAWFECLRKDMAEMDCLDVLNEPDRVFNTDESCIQLSPKCGRVLGETKNKNVYEVAPGPEKSNLTFLGTFSASGEMPTPMLIYPYCRLPKEISDSVPPTFLTWISYLEGFIR